jgi:hypothetical protein
MTTRKKCGRFFNYFLLMLARVFRHVPYNLRSYQHASEDARYQKG